MPPNVPVCMEEELGVGHCVYTMSGEEIDVDDKHPLNGKTWLDQRPYALLLPVESWVEIKKFIINVCKLSQSCKGRVDSWERLEGVSHGN